jgi:flagellar basal body-associated protein FliL
MADTPESKSTGGSTAIASALTPPAAGGRFKAVLLLAGGIVVLAAGAGYGVAFLLPGHSTPATAEAGETAEPAEPHGKPGSKEGGPVKADFVYFDFEPIVVNLDEPRLARYVRATITVAIKPGNEEAAKAMLERHKPELKNWLTLYFSSCTLDSVRGATNLNRLRREIQDAFSQQLWPDQKPLIDHVLFKEFGVS